MPSAAAGANVLSIDRAKTLRELALEKMRWAILEAHFDAGSRLVERTLCDQLNVSRSVVREVLRHLEAEGLVESTAQGPVVATLSQGQAMEIYDLRALLEGHAAARCAELATDEQILELISLNRRIQEAFAANDLRSVMLRTTDFYEAMFRIAGQQVAWSVVSGLNARINLLRLKTIGSPGRAADAGREMQRILEALRARDAPAANAAAIEHVQSVARLAGRLISA
ncbi:GntR family transcriptional regulator [Ottowia sp.]|jgi:DNA-binding GntR family transcriptional regulator|uniref:GntR family transcriptional regulator n=1 Tax=Ottowia sp. TaxID=1898956 RepID=UPI002B947965|nr:GntR family transcriptional regulator [Ottowia sp.]HRN76079.1 GntR family transcriptional regulator [Ottowia sp.]